ncbi:MAG: hypothetical protein K6U12_13395 [Armatimonadetes bacterium]|nr:hypothetical protein [Armatimonadota bacterium]CUU36921.1 hypothetical protein DCOP10_11981 [Armatimonadetes bacterium DC]
MPKLLIVWTNPASNYTPPASVLRMLQRWGYETELAYYQSTTQLHTKGAGTIVPDSATARDYLRQFDAVLVFNHVRFGSTGNSPNDGTATWLNWNTDADPPVLFFGMHLHASRSALNTRLPSDFPLVRWNPSDPNTFYEAETGVSSGTSVLTAQWNVACRGGTPVRLLRENRRVYTTSFWAHETSGTIQIYFARLDLAKHAALASTNFPYRGQTMPKGEILAVPDYPESAYSGGRSFGNDAIVAYRYAQHYLLPISGSDTRNLRSIAALYTFWLPYGLKCAGVLPRRPFPVYWEIDHFMQIYNTPGTLTERLQNLRALWDWLIDFANTRNTHIICGTVGSYWTSGTYSTAEESEVAQVLSESERQIAQQILQKIRMNHARATPVCIHDHVVMGSEGWGNATYNATIGRHAATDRWTLGKPNDVRRRTGRVVLKEAYSGTPPAGTLEVVMDGRVYYDIPLGVSEEMTGTGDLSAPHRTADYHLAKIVIERGESYVVDGLGFPDAFCGIHRYANAAANSTGGQGYWRVLREKGVRGIRAHEASARRGSDAQRVPASRVWNGLVLPIERQLEIPGSDAGGFYHGTLTSVVRPTFTIANDLTTNWGTQYEAMAWRGYQRVLTTAVNAWLGCAVHYEAPYQHPPYWASMVNPADPLASFDPARFSLYGANNPHFSFVKDLFEQMDAVIQILPAFYRWGTVSDVMDRIEEEA